MQARYYCIRALQLGKLVPDIIYTLFCSMDEAKNDDKMNSLKEKNTAPRNVISSKLWHPESRNFRIPSPLSTFLAAGLAIGIISMQAGCSRYWFACLVQTFLGSVSSVHGIIYINTIVSACGAWGSKL